MVSSSLKYMNSVLSESCEDRFVLLLATGYVEAV